MYYLQPAVLAPPPALRITKKEFDALSDARRKLVAGFPIEENFDLLIGNYLELEQTALSLAALDMVRCRTSYQDFFEVRADLNRRAVDFLHASRVYVELHASRVYVESLGVVQKLVRQTVAPTLQAARASVETAIRRYKKYTNSQSIGLTAYFSIKGKVEKQVPVFIEWENVRAKLEMRNGILINLRKRFVSSIATR
ncbi:hypothetical protein [Azovibrio restrictus]|uniref:hypothetical protein n=1 Tax=Azovibrio restrictus TaxID=146938 RepID=UPI0012EC0666|nr:hypothetical protein [Azovibrio restrictus]